ncbi:MAG TPA: tetratricopeptide repeat protein, partial [Pyrinomonadaceae bacterium]|nr:tetratricopeptide repeat protein [Pyrinomonadaceae bacterium]
FEAVGSQEDNSFIGIGLASVITTDLAKVNGISVLSKAAGAGRAHETGHGARELARELGANILLEGEVMRAGQNIRIQARLTDVETGRVIWGDRYRGDESQLFDMQDSVCRSVADALRVSLSSEVREQMAHPPTTDINAFELYSKARAFLERREIKGNVDFAMRMFEEALKLDPQFAAAQAGLGEAYWLKYDETRDGLWVQRALAASDRALVLDPNQPQVHVSLGIIYQGTGKLTRAVEEFERALSLQPLSDDAHRWLGRCFMQKGELERAISHFKKAIEIRPGYWDNYDRLGVCYYLMGRYEEAAEQFRHVIAIQPDSYKGYNNLGGIYYLMGRYEDAIPMSRRANEIHPTADAYSNLGSNYFYLERYAEAIEAYKSAIELNPGDDILYRNLGDAYLRAGNRPDAEAHYQLAAGLLRKSLLVAPGNAELLGRLAVCQAKLGRTEEALQNIESAASGEPHNTKLQYQKAVVYALAGRDERALEYLAHALSHGYSNSEALRDPDLLSLRDSAEFTSLFPPPA